MLGEGWDRERWIVKDLNHHSGNRIEDDQRSKLKLRGLVGMFHILTGEISNIHGQSRC